MTRVLALDDIRPLVDQGEAIAAVRDALITHARGQATSPFPWRLELPDVDGEIHVKGAHLRGAPYLPRSSEEPPDDARAATQLADSRHARLLFSGGQVFDGTGAPPARADVVVEDGRIAEVGTGLDGDEAVDCTGRAILPGFIDCHVHLMESTLDQLEMIKAPFSLQFYEAARNMRLTLAAGVTTVREAGGADLGVKVAQQRGLIAGPRLQISISMVSQTGGHCDWWEPSGGRSPIYLPHPGRPDAVVDGPEEVRKKVRELLRAGADVIKVATSGGVFSPRDDPRHAHFRDDEISVMVTEARAAGRFVMSHATGSDGIKAAVRCGVRSVEHGDFVDEETIEMMVGRGTWLVPTVAALHGLLEAGQAGVLADQAMLDKVRLVMKAQQDSLGRAIAAGVPIAMGSDADCVPHGDNLRELECLVDYGMTPAAALHAATLSGAKLMGLGGEIGSVEPGKRADLVVVDGDPLEISGLRHRVRAVYQNGRLVHGSLGAG